MTRGRKKDLTIPPTRSLTQQRDYRARKATYIASLEERCRKAEEENDQLRKELAQTRARLANPVLLLPETAEASEELMHNLAMASASLTKFQQLAFAGAKPTAEISSRRTQQSNDFHATPQAPSESHNAFQATFPSPQTRYAGRKRLFSESDGTPPYSPTTQTASSTVVRSPSPSSDEECCGGYLDCDALDYDGILEQREERPRNTISRISGMRSTSDYRSQSS
ncbi:hypothetical protein BDZ97DRAFT_1914080 [Flammula alnicola]|nr:hypothetical protein BDZ97DRAFT_1914080 [Flammula alnicola]